MSGPFRSPSLADRPHRPATRQWLGAPLPHQQPDGPHAPPPAPKLSLAALSVRGISTPFGALFPTKGQVRTCSSAVRRCRSEDRPHDLHALGTPPALILSQDQTRHQTVKRTGDHASHPASPPCGWRGRRTLHTSVGKVRATKKRAGGPRTAKLDWNVTMCGSARRRDRVVADVT